MRRRWNGYRELRRAGALVAGVLLVGLTATPAWADPPDAPAQPSVTAGNASILVTFDAPFDGNSAISGYAADCESADIGAASGNNTGPADASPITVSGLTNGATYTCTVTATNGDGTSDLSPESAPVVPSTVPAAPAKPSVVAGNASIVVTYSPPDDGGNAITLYTASCQSTDLGAASGSNTDPNGDPITVSGLTNASPYTCTVTATNANGDGVSPESDSVMPSTIPDAPPQPTLTPGNHLLQVAFGAANNEGSTITSYTASCSSGTGVPGSHSGPAEPLTVTGLTNGATYTCTVTATNANGTSDPSPESPAATPAAVPNAPTVNSVTRANTAVRVAFTAGNDNGNPITSFTASCASTNGGAAGAHSSTSSPITVTGLTNGKTYKCKVTETNALGTSPPSALSAAVIPATVPHAPTIGSLASGNGSATVWFTAGANNGAAITSYTATCTSANGGAVGSHSGTTAPITVPSLTNGRIYTCTARATNAMGTSSASAASKGLVVGQPAAPTKVVAVSLSTTTATGSMKVSFTPGPSNGSAISSYGAECTPINGGATVHGTAAHSLIVLSNLTTGKTYSCTATATNARGTSFDSSAARATEGAPGAPTVLRTLPINQGIVMPFTMAVANGSAIVNYRARCTSSNGGAAGSPLQVDSPIVATKLTDGKTYTCTVTANNGRGEGAPTVVGPVVVGRPNITNLASCSGNTGSVAASPGLYYSSKKSQTFTVTSTLNTCSGPYVSVATIAMTFHSPQQLDCQNAINVASGGSGTFTWTDPPRMGKSSAAVQFVITSTTGHITKVHFSGTVTSQSNMFTGNHVSGNLTLNRGLHTVAAGGNCTATQPLTTFAVSAATMTVS